MKLHIFVEDDKKRAKSNSSRTKLVKPTKSKPPKANQTAKQRAAQKAYWANRKSSEKKEKAKELKQNDDKVTLTKTKQSANQKSIEKKAEDVNNEK